MTKKYGDLDLMGLVGELSDQAKAANDGDLKRAEGMLMVQAHTLDAIFNSLAQRSINAEYMDALDRYLRLALKAQSQCRATLETLAAIKIPAPMALVRQANIGYNQQVNNSAGRVDDPSRAGENPNPQNELLEAKPYERLDTGTPGATVGAASVLETVEKSTGPRTPGGKVGGYRGTPTRAGRGVYCGNWRRRYGNKPRD